MCGVQYVVVYMLIISRCVLVVPILCKCPVVVYLSVS